MRWLLLLGGLCGCDAVFGLDDTALPKCTTKRFDGEVPTVIRSEETIDKFSFSRDREHAVLQINGIIAEATRDGEPKDLPLKPMYPSLSIALEPENKFMFFTPAIEPPVVLAANRTGDNEWKFEPKVPKGTFAGTPTTSKTGEPVRVVVRLFEIADDFQEYERDGDGNWNPIGERFHMNALVGANLSASGLVLVYDGTEGDTRGVYVRVRGQRSDPFEAPNVILEGPHLQPQLSDDCSELFVIDDSNGASALVRYQK
jgi:hypothetical protein